MTIETGDTIEFEYIGRTEDGSVFDTSRESIAAEAGLSEAQPDREYAPISVEIGAGQVIEGLEEALVGLEQGSTPTVAVPPEKGYGEWSEEQVREYDIEELSQTLGGQTPKEGAFLETQDGTRAEVVHVDDELARLDFNSPLAGETLEFDIEVVTVN